MNTSLSNILFYSSLKRIYISIVLVGLLVATNFLAYAQHTLTGSFQELAHQTIRFYGYDGVDTYLIDSVKADKKGVFRLSYAAKDYGMAYLKAKDEKAFTIVIYEEDISLQGENFAYPESINIIESKENLILEQYVNEHIRREQVKEAVKLVNGAYEAEASGGITTETLRAYAETGVDFISVGALTYSIKSLDLSLKAM